MIISCKSVSRRSRRVRKTADRNTKKTMHDKSGREREPGVEEEGQRLTRFKLGLNGGLVSTRSRIPELIPTQSINSGAGMSSVLLFSKSK
jgi:hypothetical protein